MLLEIEGCQLECLDATVYDTDIAPGDLFVSRGKLYTCREVERVEGECEYPKRFCKHFPGKGHPKFVFAEEIFTPFDAKGFVYRVAAIDGEKL